MTTGSTPDRLDAPEWRGQRGHYEAWFLTGHDPASGWALWLRHTLHVPTDLGEPGEASLWAFAFPPPGAGEAPLALRDRYPLEAFRDRTRAGVFGLGLGPATLSGARARGAVGVGERRIAWDLAIDRRGGWFQHVSPRLQRCGVAGSAVATPGMRLGVSGTLEVGARRLELREASAERGHVFGRRHADAWAWAHTHTLTDAGGHVRGAFEGVSARLRKLGRLLPPASALCLELPGRQVAVRGALAVWRPRASFELGRWAVEARRGDLLLAATVTAPPESFVCVEYADPDGRRVYCHHTERARTIVELSARRGDAWVPELRLESPGTTAFEVGGPEPDPRAGGRLTLAEARPAS